MMAGNVSQADATANACALPETLADTCRCTPAVTSHRSAQPMMPPVSVILTG